MNSYTVRVELHSSQYNPDFKILHQAMENQGFSKLIKSIAGKIYHLPRGEYIMSTPKNRSEVFNIAKRAVETTRKTAEILVTESSGWTFDGLTEEN